MPSSGSESQEKSESGPDPSQQDLLTRYALNQLKGEERDAVMTLLKESPSARKFLQDYRSNLLDAERQQAAAAGDGVEGAASNNSSEPPASEVLPWAKLVPTAAVALVVGLGVMWGIQHGASHTPVAAPVAQQQDSTKDNNPAPPTAPVEQSTSSNSVATPATPTGATAAPPASLPPQPAPNQTMASSNSIPPTSAQSEGNTPATQEENPLLKFPVIPPSIPHNAPAPLPPVQVDTSRSILDFSNVGLTGLRYVPSEMSTVRNSVDIGFFVPSLTLSASDEQPASSGNNDSAFVPADHAAAVSVAPPFKLFSQVFPSPWNPGCQLVLMGVKSVPPVHIQKVPANLAFLIDVSDSMSTPERLPLLRAALIKFIDQLGPEDRVGIVLYSGASTKLLPSTPGNERTKIATAVYSLQTYNRTVNGPGLQMAYDIVQAHYLKDAVNQVILMTDGDFSFGLTAQDGLMEYVADHSHDGIGLSLIGVGTDMLADPEWKTLMELGHGTYSQVGSVDGADEILSMHTRKLVADTATDVKVEMSIGDKQVRGCRLIGYDNQWPSHPTDGVASDGKAFVLALYEVDPAEGGLPAHPLLLKSTYHTAYAAHEQVVSEAIPEPARNGDVPLFDPNEIITQVEAQKHLSTKQVPDQTTATDRQDSEPILTSHATLSPDGKIDPDDYRMLQERAKAWLETPDAAKNGQNSPQTGK